MKAPILGKYFYSFLTCLWLGWCAVAQAAAPTIAGTWPAVTTPGTAMIVFGADFSVAAGGNKVSFGGVPAPLVQPLDSTLLLFLIPSGGTSGEVCVNTLAGSSCFTPPVCSGLCITGMWPANVKVNEIAYLFGSGFSSPLKKMNVNGVTAPLRQVLDPGILFFMVPLGVVSPLTVEVCDSTGQCVCFPTSCVPRVSFDTATSRGSETLTLSDISVSMDRVSDKPVTVNWAIDQTVTGSGVASNYLDYLMLPSGSTKGILTFAPGSAQQTIRIVNRRDNLAEINETVTLALSSPSNATLDTAKAKHTYTILDSPPRGVPGDFWADVVLGQRDHTESTTNTVVLNHAFNVGGIVVDRVLPPRGSTTTAGRAYVWDGGNNRILGFNLDDCYQSSKACDPALVIGQLSGSEYGSCNQDASMSYYPYLAPASASTLCGTAAWYISPKEGARRSSMAVDQATGDLYVPDYENHRVLVFKDPFTGVSIVPPIPPTNYIIPAANYVIGQDDFSGVYCNKVAYERKGNYDGFTAPISNPSSSSLCAMSEWNSQGFGVALDASGNLWVADGGNNRVLRFPKDPLTKTISKSADLVLGQPNFTSRAGGPGLAQLQGPTSLAFGPDGKLYVADGSTQEQDGNVYDNSRVLVFTPPFGNGMPGTRFAGNTVFNRPYIRGVRTETGLDMLPTGLWISSWVPNVPFKVEHYNWDGTWIRALPTWQNAPNSFDGAIDVDNAGNILVPGGRDVSDVVIYKAKANNYLDQPTTLLSPPFIYNIASDSHLFYAGGIASAGNQLYVADHHRIMIWNNLGQLTDGKAADSFIGQVDFNSFDRLFNGDNPYTQMKIDSKLRLWVASRNRIFVFQTPLYTWSKPIKVIQGPLGVLNSAEQIANLSDNGREIGLVPMVTASNGDFLWIAQPFNHRVLRIRDPLGVAPKVDVVLGQVDLSGQCCNGMPKDTTKNICPTPDSPFYSINLAPPVGGAGTLDKLCHPYNLSMDRNQDLYVSDHITEGLGNMRMLMFKTSNALMFPTNNLNVIYAPLAYKEFPRPNAATFEAAFNTFVAGDSVNRMVVGYDSYGGHSPYVGIYENPELPSVTAPTCTRPSGESDCYLNDHMLMAGAATFDILGNLYVADGNRTKVFIYKQPFTSIPGSQPGHAAMKTVTSRIATSSDDAFTCGSIASITIINPAAYSEGNFTYVGNNVRCPGGIPAGPAIAGLRFNVKDIPPTAQIDHAVIIYKPTGGSTDKEPKILQISGVANVNQSTFSEKDNLNKLTRIKIDDTVTSGPVTVNFDGNDNGAWQVGHWHATPNLKEIVQRIIRLTGWDTGSHSMAFLISSIDTPTERSFFAYDSDPNNAPILYIQYH